MSNPDHRKTNQEHDDDSQDDMRSQVSPDLDAPVKNEDGSVQPVSG